VVTARRKLVELYQREAKFGLLTRHLRDRLHQPARRPPVTCRETIIAAK
jgi:hypothetical protein